MNTATVLQTMDQQRASFALKEIEKLTQQTPAFQAEIRRHVNGLPAMIHINGLGQALAFYRMKGLDSSHGTLYQIVSNWLCGDTPGRVFSGSSDALSAITAADMFAYMAAQNEAQALLEWLKKFALALLHKAD
jgi:CRISPR-associated protein Cmr5